MYKEVHRQHERHGKLVRIQPNHISVADPKAIDAIYGHGNGFIKAPYYEAFKNVETSIVTTRNRVEHTRKRKRIAHAFSPKAVLDFEPYTQRAIIEAIAQFNSLIKTGRAGQSKSLATISEENALIDGEIAFDIAPWTAYIAFDIISDLAFGEPFAFVSAGIDKDDNINLLLHRSEFAHTVGAMPWIKSFTPYFFDSFFSKGLTTAQNVAKVAMAGVNKRRQNDSPRKDLLYYLLNAKDQDGQYMNERELNAEVLTLLGAGSDTTSNTLTNIIDLLCRHPRALAILQEELDKAFPESVSSDVVPPYENLKDLPYLNAVINEALRFRPVVTTGLPRQVPKGGATVAGIFFKEGTVLSSPTYTIHRNEQAFENPDAFFPERWLGSGRFESEKYFLGFSAGPRACIGRNVASMELKKNGCCFIPEL